MFRLCFTLSLSLLLPTVLSGQQEQPSPAGERVFPEFAPPLEIPLRLSGGFGELRAAHFHAGLDFRTQGVTGKRVISSEKGYISRIAVSPGGYGKAVYVTHSGGWTTVYGHLERFNDKVAQWVENYQYDHQSFAVDVTLDETQFPVERGELLAYSGNTGSSGGPHLHYEVREANGERPLNPHLFGMKVPDKTAPILKTLLLNPVTVGGNVNGRNEKLKVPLVSAAASGTYRPAETAEFVFTGAIGVALEAFDTSEGSVGRSGIYTLSLYVDTMLFYSRRWEGFSYGESRYTLAMKDYPEYLHSRTTFEQLFRLPGNPLSWIHTPMGSGVLQLSDSRVYQIRIEAEDFAGNQSIARFSARWKPLPEGEPVATALHNNAMRYDRDNRFSAKSIEVMIPSGALYNNIDFAFQTIPANNSVFGEGYSLHLPETPLHKPITLSIKGDAIPESLRAKAYIAELDDAGRPEGYLGGEWKGSYMEARCYSFGKVGLAVDTIAPKILVATVNPAQGKLVFQVSDNMSGVNSIEGLLDGKWVLYEHDGKTARVEFILNRERFPKTGKSREFLLKVTDALNNVSEYRRTFVF